MDDIEGRCQDSVLEDRSEAAGSNRFLSVLLCWIEELEGEKSQHRVVFLPPLVADSMVEDRKSKSGPRPRKRSKLTSSLVFLIRDGGY